MAARPSSRHPGSDFQPSDSEAESAIPGWSANPDQGVIMRCEACGNPAVASCTFCDNFICQHHCNVWFGRACCPSCHEKLLNNKYLTFISTAFFAALSCGFIWYFWFR